MRKIPIEQSIGMALGHDITKIVPGRRKYCAFSRGHIISPEDIPLLRDMGKEHIWVGELSDNLVHEDEAALRLAQSSAGPGVTWTTPNQGRVNLVAKHDGLLQVQVSQLMWLNNLDNIVFATLHNNSPVVKGQVIAGTRIVPLAVESCLIKEAEKLCSNPLSLVSVKHFRPLWVAVITTGSEVNNGQIRDGFGKIIRQKIAPYGGRWMSQVIIPDDCQIIASEIQNFIAEGAQLILVTGGMSVDADDATPKGIRESGAELVFYGAPVLPGSQFMLLSGPVAICGAYWRGSFSAQKTTLILFFLVSSRKIRFKNQIL